MEEFSSHVIISVRVYHIRTLAREILICFLCFAILCSSVELQRVVLVELPLAQKETVVLLRVLLSPSETALVSV